MTGRTMIKIALRSIFRNRMRSLLTSLGIIIGVGSVIIMVGVGRGSQQQIEDQIESMGTNLIMVAPERGPGVANRLTVDDVDKIRKESGYIQAVSGTARRSATVIGGGGDWSPTVEGVETGYLTVKQWGVTRGSFFTDRDNASRRKVAVLGATVAEELFGNEDPVGAEVRIDRTPFTVIGVLESKGSNAMGNDQDDTVLVPLMTALSRLTGSRYVSTIQISAVSEEFMEPAQAEIEQILRESHRLRAGDENDFRIINQAEIIDMATSTSRTLTVLLAAVAGVSLIVGGIGIMNIMLVSVTERTREIGIRMSVGARSGDIMLQFLSESVLLSLIGGCIGIVSALTLGLVMNKFLSVPVIINPGIVVLSAGFAAAVGIFFGYYPAKKASRLYPIDALRYE
jgi:putative ABC transport system permease protein